MRSLDKRASAYTEKNIRISIDILWQIFYILTKPVPSTFVFVNRRNSEVRAHIIFYSVRICRSMAALSCDFSTTTIMTAEIRQPMYSVYVMSGEQ